MKYKIKTQVIRKLREKYTKLSVISKAKKKVDLYLNLVENYNYDPQYLEIDRELIIKEKSRITSIKADICYYSKEFNIRCLFFICEATEIPIIVKKMYKYNNVENINTLKNVVFVNSNIKNLDITRVSSYKKWLYINKRYTNKIPLFS